MKEEKKENEDQDRNGMKNANTKKTDGRIEKKIIWSING